MIYGLLFFLSLVVFELFLLLKMGENAKNIIASSRKTMRVLASRELADDEKETFMRRGSIEILEATLRLAGKLLLAGGILFALFQLIVAIFPGLQPLLIESLASPVDIAILTAAVIGYARVRAWARNAVLRRLE